jgi:hypothetical protein
LLLLLLLLLLPTNEGRWSNEDDAKAMVAYVVAWSPGSLLPPPGSNWQSLRDVALDSHVLHAVVVVSAGVQEEDWWVGFGNVYIMVADEIKAKIPARATSPSEEDVDDEVVVQDTLSVAVVNRAAATAAWLGKWMDPKDGWAWWRNEALCKPLSDKVVAAEWNFKLFLLRYDVFPQLLLVVVVVAPPLPLPPLPLPPPLFVPA